MKAKVYLFLLILHKLSAAGIS